MSSPWITFSGENNNNVSLLSRNQTINERFTAILDESEKQFTCLICSEVLLMPSTIKCGHTFCKSCIEDWFETKENCPCCRESCSSGVHSESVDVYVEYLIRVKPLLHYRTLRGEDEEDISEDTANRLKLATGTDEKLMQYMGESLKKVLSQRDRRKLECSLSLARKMLGSGESMDQIQYDLRSSSNFKNMVQKYYQNSTLGEAEDLQGYEYVPVTRTKEYYLEYPTRGSQLCILGIIVCSVLFYYLFAQVDETVYEDLQQSLLRILGVLSFYLSTFEELYS